LAELDIEEGGGLEEYKDVGEEEKEEDDIEEEGIEWFQVRIWSIV